MNGVKKRVLSALLSAVMIFGTASVSAFGADENAEKEEPAVVVDASGNFEEVTGSLSEEEIIETDLVKIDDTDVQTQKNAEKVKEIVDNGMIVFVEGEEAAELEKTLNVNSDSDNIEEGSKKLGDCYYSTSNGYVKNEILVILAEDEYDPIILNRFRQINYIKMGICDSIVSDIKERINNLTIKDNYYSNLQEAILLKDMSNISTKTYYWWKEGRPSDGGTNYCWTSNTDEGSNYSQLASTTISVGYKKLDNGYSVVQGCVYVSPKYEQSSTEHKRITDYMVQAVTDGTCYECTACTEGNPEKTTGTSWTNFGITIAGFGATIPIPVPVNSYTFKEGSQKVSVKNKGLNDITWTCETKESNKNQGYSISPMLLVSSGSVVTFNLKYLKMVGVVRTYKIGTDYSLPSTYVNTRY